jgi:hypothetical protein
VILSSKFSSNYSCASKAEANNMTLTQIPILDQGGVLLPLTENHIDIAPNPLRIARYARMSLESLLLRTEKGFITTIDLFMELHRRASTAVMHGEGCYVWDCVPFTNGENSWAEQLERARLIMTYDYRWHSFEARSKKSVRSSENEEHNPVEMVQVLASSYVQSYVRWSKGKRQVLLPDNPKDFD